MARLRERIETRNADPEHIVRTEDLLNARGLAWGPVVVGKSIGVVGYREQNRLQYLSFCLGSRGGPVTSNGHVTVEWPGEPVDMIVEAGVM
jgi:hypothetical protein